MFVLPIFFCDCSNAAQASVNSCIRFMNLSRIWKIIFIISSSPLNNFVVNFSNYFQVSAIVWSQGSKQIWKKQGWSEWHKMNYQLKSPPSLARIVLGNIGPLSFLFRPRYARSVLSRNLTKVRRWGTHARLVRS